MTETDGYGSCNERVPILRTEAKFGVKLERLQGDKVPVNTQTTQSASPFFPSSSPVPPSSADRLTRKECCSCPSEDYGRVWLLKQQTLRYGRRCRAAHYLSSGIAAPSVKQLCTDLSLT